MMVVIVSAYTVFCVTNVVMVILLIMTMVTKMILMSYRYITFSKLNSKLTTMMIMVMQTI